MKLDLQKKAEAIFHARSRSKDVSYLLERASKIPRNDTFASNIIDKSIDSFNTPINFLSNMTHNFSAQETIVVYLI